MSTTTTQGVTMQLDDNKKPIEAFTPKTIQHLTGVETTTVVGAVVDTSLVRIVAKAAINYAVTTSTTDAVTTDMAYLVANTPELVKVNKERDRINFLGSSEVYIISLM